MFPWQPILGGLLIFGLRVLSVSMGTLRTLLIVRGSRLISAAIGFFEVLIFVVAISQVISDLSNIWNLLGYCGGFAAGVLVGMTLEERLAVGLSMVRIISRTHWLEITQALRQEGYGATQVVGEGKDGTVGIVYSMVQRRKVPAVVKLCEQMDGHSFITVEEAGRVHRGYVTRPAR